MEVYNVGRKVYRGALCGGAKMGGTKCGGAKYGTKCGDAKCGMQSVGAQNTGCKMGKSDFFAKKPVLNESCNFNPF